MRRKHRRLEQFVILLATLILVFGSCLSCIKQTRFDITQFGSSTRSTHFSSVVRVSSNPANPMSKAIFGTAFAVTPDLLMTTGHLCIAIQGRLDSGQDTGIEWDLVDEKGTISEGEVETEIVAVHDTLDMCLLKSEEHGLIPTRLSQRVDLIMTGDTLTMAGYPHGVPYLIQKDGRLISLSDKVLYADLFVESGNSGSPVFWMDEVVGMVISMPISPHTVIRQTSYAISVKELQKFLSDNLGD